MQFDVNTLCITFMLTPKRIKILCHLTEEFYKAAVIYSILHCQLLDVFLSVYINVNLYQKIQTKTTQSDVSVDCLDYKTPISLQPREK